MNAPLIVKNDITIDAPATQVWDALTKPEWTKQYMFGCEPITDWKPGSPLLWKGTFNDVEMVAVKGQVVRFEPPRSLVYTVIDPNNPAIPDLPQNYLTVNCQLLESSGRTQLTVTQGDYSIVAEGQSRYQDTIAGGGWSSILDQIKQLVEK